MVEYWLRIAGEMRHYEARIVRCDANHVLSVVRDTTERKHAEHALQASHERYALATGAGSVGVWDWNLQTNDFYVDSSLKATLGYEQRMRSATVSSIGAAASIRTTSRG